KAETPSIPAVSMEARRIANTFFMIFSLSMRGMYNIVITKRYAAPCRNVLKVSRSRILRAACIPLSNAMITHYT
ncbi:MAG: hypothetical protein WCQ72_06270, partial [Eubacteriales bacterium]